MDLETNSVAVDSSGNVYVSNCDSSIGSGDIQKYNSKGIFLFGFGSFSSIDGDLNPESIAVDSSGNVYVADYDNNRIQKFSRNGSFITTWKWDFGDGTTSTTHNPIHTYIKTGSHTVTLTATNSAGSNTATKTNYIKVTNAVKPVAAFSASPTSGTKPLKVQFTDKSTGSPTS